MTQRTVVVLPILALLAAVAAGCASSLEVRVQKLLGVSSTRLSAESALGRQLSDAMARLGRVVAASDTIEAEMPSLREASEKSAPKKPKGRETTVEETGRARSIDPLTGETAAVPQDPQADAARFRELVAKLDRGPDFRNRAIALIAEVSGYFDAPDISARKGGAYETLARVRAFLIEVENWRRSVEPELRAAAERDRSLGDALDKLEGAAPAAGSLLGFGGFMSSDVYVVNPSDPSYERVLRAPESHKPLSLATAYANGDATLMFVVESAGQVRVYQVSNDPTQLTRNISFIITKGISAAARYLLAGVGGGALTQILGEAGEVAPASAAALTAPSRTNARASRTGGD